MRVPVNTDYFPIVAKGEDPSLKSKNEQVFLSYSEFCYSSQAPWSKWQTLEDVVYETPQQQT